MHGESEFNCNDCSFQSNSKSDLKKQLRLTHHESSKNTEEINKEKNFPCRSCGLGLMSKKDLMNHRREIHSDILRQCRYFARGDCAFEDEVCWYSHKKKEENVEPSSADQENLNCNLCKRVFKNKDEFMKHRKVNHPLMISKCRDFKNGECRFTDDECWYVHEEISSNMSQGNSVFWKVPENHSPDLMTRIIDMMEKLTKKVETLEKLSNQNQ